MRIFCLFIVTLCVVLASQGQPAPQPHATAPTAKTPANYLIRVEWTEPNSDPKFLEVLTTEGQFELDTIQKNSVKINNQDIPITLKLRGNLTVLSNDAGSLKLFLGRTVPYVTGTYGNGASMSTSYSQLSVGLDSTFIVHFGKPETIQTDDSGKISVLVKLEED